MNKHIDVSFGGGTESVFFSVRMGRFFSYEQDREELHSRYGGKQYYWSRSGLSGAGYLEPAPDENDLVLFGFYRTDARDEKHGFVVHRTADGKNVSGFAPTRSHEGIDEERPFVLSDGRMVAFVPGCEVARTLLNWDDLEGREIELSYFDQYGEELKFSFQLHNPNHFCGVRATRFVDLSRALEAADRIDQAREEAGHPSAPFQRELKIKQLNGEWYHLSKDNYFDQKWSEDPSKIEGEIVDGWYGTGGDFYFRRSTTTNVHAFMDISAVGGGSLQHYIQDFSVLEWYRKPIKYWGEYFSSVLVKDAVEEQQRKLHNYLNEPLIEVIE